VINRTYTTTRDTVGRIVSEVDSTGLVTAYTYVLRTFFWS